MMNKIDEIIRMIAYVVGGILVIYALYVVLKGVF